MVFVKSLVRLFGEEGVKARPSHCTCDFHNIPGFIG